MRSPTDRLALFTPPYDSFRTIRMDWRPERLPPRGMALVWWLVDGEEQQAEYRWLSDRPFGLPLFVILPPAAELARAMPLLAYVNGLEPRAVLPSASVVAPAYLRCLLATPPRDLASAVTRYLTRRGLLMSEAVRDEVDQIFRHVPDIASISRLARRLYTSRRTLGRHFSAAGLPVPSHWLQFARLLYAIMRLQCEKVTVFRVASRTGYPDGFTMSNQMKRMIGVRPTEVRSFLGWEWIVESWIRREVRTGGFDLARFGNVIRAYGAGPSNSYS